MSQRRLKPRSLAEKRFPNADADTVLVLAAVVVLDTAVPVIDAAPVMSNVPGRTAASAGAAVPVLFAVSPTVAVPVVVDAVSPVVSLPMAAPIPVVTAVSVVAAEPVLAVVSPAVSVVSSTVGVKSADVMKSVVAVLSDSREASAAVDVDTTMLLLSPAKVICFVKRL